MFQSNLTLPAGISLEIEYPRWEQLMPHQQEVIRDPHKFKVLVWHRRARKTTTALTELVKQALYRVGAYWIIFPTYGEAKDAVWRDPDMLFRIIPKEIISRTNESELIVYFKNGSYIQLKGADDPDALRGAGPKGIVFDEFGKVKYEAWEIVEKIVRANDGWAWFIGTPVGKNHLYDLYELGQNGEDDEWKSWLLKSSVSGIIPADQLEKSRRTSSQAHFNQEWECEFLEGEGQVFRGVREVAKAIPLGPLPGHEYVMGVDLAKERDYTAITVYDRETNKQVFQDRFQKFEWPFQKAKMISISRHYNKAVIVIDATGLGSPIVDDLARSGLAIQPVKFTSTSKKALIEKLSIWIERRLIAILPIEESLKEFDNFGYTIGPTGIIRYGAPEGRDLHDDIVISHALSIHELQEHLKDPTIKELSLIKREYQKRFLQQSYENSDEFDTEQWGA